MRPKTEQDWRRIGAAMGAEHAEIRLRSGEALVPATLQIPPGVPPAYVEGLQDGYLQFVAGNGEGRMT